MQFLKKESTLTKVAFNGFQQFFFLIKLNNNLYLLLNKLKNKLYLRAFEQTENSTVNMPIKQVFIYIYIF